MLGATHLPCDQPVAAARTGCAPEHRRWVLAATIIGSGMTFIDGTVVNVALPALQATLGATAAQVQWVVESYALCLSALILVGGALGDRFGRRRVFAVGITVFGLGSAWCSVARSPAELIVARALQGVGAALLVPGSLAIISAEFDERERGRAIGTWSAATAILAAGGPVLGGWLIERFSWRAVFLINIPLCVVVLPMLYRHVRETRDPEAPSRLDWRGAMLAIAGLGALVYGFIEAPARGFGAAPVWASIAGGSVILLAFGVAEVRQAHAMVPPRLFRSRTFTGANVLTLLLYGALSGALFFVPFQLIQVRGFSATAAGAALLPFVLTIFLLSRWAGGLVDRFGARGPLVVGPAVAAAGFALVAVAGGGANYWSGYFPGLTVLGLGMAIAVAPLTTTVMNSVDTNHAGAASGINNAVARTAGVLAVAMFGVLVFGHFQSSLASRVAQVSRAPSATAFVERAGTEVGAAAVPADLGAAVAQELRNARDTAFTESFQLAMLVAAGLAAASAASAAILIETRPART